MKHQIQKYFQKKGKLFKFNLINKIFTNRVKVKNYLTKVNYMKITKINLIILFKIKIQKKYFKWKIKLEIH